ncbi:MAG TPA: 2-amino-4-hydroxy-6-hydroxymethyldihydropteridine diphosphokinase, partial [Rubrivivax sp.]|nr:2-amino-4-hydroxy-6-hydroxymethyldihydropteridine diphosphokinase [Rubrivivax sp.]
LETTLDPWALLQALQTLEGAHGLTRPYRHAPRTLDLDLLLYDSLEVADPSLQLPHPRMHLRAFVLRPLLELSPQAVIPGHGPARSWLDRLDTPPLRRWQGQDDGRPQDP